MSLRNSVVFAAVFVFSTFTAAAVGQIRTQPMNPASAPSAAAPTATEQIASARTTLEQMAAYARQAQQAAALAAVAPASSPAVPPPLPSLPPGQLGGMFNRSESMPPTDDSGPRLIEISGVPGHEEARIALAGYVYTVSRASPEVGISSWKLQRIDVAERAVVLREEAAQGRKARTVRLGFAQRETRTSTSTGSATPGGYGPSPLMTTIR